MAQQNKDSVSQAWAEGVTLLPQREAAILMLAFLPGSSSVELTVKASTDAPVAITRYCTSSSCYPLPDSVWLLLDGFRLFTTTFASTLAANTSRLYFYLFVCIFLHIYRQAYLACTCIYACVYVSNYGIPLRLMQIRMHARLWGIVPAVYRLQQGEGSALGGQGLGFIGRTVVSRRLWFS